MSGTTRDTDPWRSPGAPAAAAVGGQPTSGPGLAGSWKGARSAQPRSRGVIIRTGAARHAAQAGAAGCKKGIAGLVLPMGYSFNLDGTAIYLTLASMFIAQACDISLSWMQIVSMLGLMLLTSKGPAGVTGSGFVALVATLTVMPDLPVAGVAMLVGMDRFMSEARALTSIISQLRGQHRGVDVGTCLRSRDADA